MFSRFITWQIPTLSTQAEAEEVNTFRVSGDCLDIRFGLKGYGFKRVGESQRVIHHFGCYKCFVRKVGDPEFQLFAHTESERAASNDPNVYKNVFVSTGVLDFGEYEVKVEACRLRELKTWGGGVVEGIDDDEQFWFDLSARQPLPIRLRADEGIEIVEFANQGLDPLPLGVIDPNPIFFDGLQAVDVLKDIVLEHNIQQFEFFPVTDVLTIQYDYDLLLVENIPVVEFVAAYPTTLPMLLGDQTTITEFRQVVIPGYNFGVDTVKVLEFVAAQIPFIFQVFESISVQENVEVNKPFFRQVQETFTITEFRALNVVGIIENALDNVGTLEFISVAIPFNTTPLPFDAITIAEFAAAQRAFTIEKFEQITLAEFTNLIFFGEASLVDSVNVAESATVQIPFSINRFDFVAVIENVSVRLPLINVFESRLVTEFIKIELLSPSRFDNIFITEFRDVRLASLAVATDNVAIAEQLFIRIVLDINRFESISVVESVAAANTNISRFDSVAVTEFVALAPSPLLSVSENVSVAEFRDVSLPLLFLPTFAEFFSVVEFVDASAPNTLKRDDILVIEFLDISLPQARIAEFITVNEFASTLLPILNATRVEFVAVLDVLAIGVDQLFITVSETITITEVFGGLNISDDITVVDVAVVEIAPQLVVVDDEASVNGALFDVILVGEFVELQTFVFIDVNVFDNVATFDTIGPAIGVGFAVVDGVAVQGALFDTVGITEFAAAFVFNIPVDVETVFDNAAVNGALFDTVGTAEAVSFEFIQSIDTLRFDNVTADEEATLEIPTLVVVDEGVGISGALVDTVNVNEFVSVGII